MRSLHKYHIPTAKRAAISPSVQLLSLLPANIQEHPTRLGTRKNLESFPAPMFEPEMPVPFIYPPISTGSGRFRLLRILPIEADDTPISCELFTASIKSKAGNYIAGSYTWGLDSPNLPIVLNGATFYVRENLFQFLRVLRSEQTVTTIWIDAICIDQSNSLERTQQVGLMTEIYEHASGVAIWMGPSSKSLDRSMDMICLLGSDRSIHVDPRHGASILVANGDELGQIITVTPFFNLPWWFRIW
jgi:hypothetical protein